MLIMYNRLSLNLLKSSYFISTTKHKTNPSINFCINVGGHAIPCLESAKYSGGIIDKQLTWSNHVNFIINKLAKAAGMLSQVRHYASKVTLVKLYYGFVYPYLKYGIIAWAVYLTVTTNLWQLNIITTQGLLLIKIIIRKERTHSPDNAL